MNKIDFIRQIEARNELYAREARNGNFKSYCLYTDYSFFTRRPVLGKVADAFQRVHDAFVAGTPIHIAVSMPPRSGKSYLTSLFCSFMLGRFPEESIMRNSCTSKLYQKLSKDVRDIVDSDKWRYVFNMELATKGVESWGLKAARQTSYFGAGVDGTIIGFGASMLSISDDLYKDIADALSDNQNETIIEWYDSAMNSRVERKCCKIDIGTRWRKNDIIGRNEMMGKYDYVIKIPALNEKGESFCEDVRSTEQYLSEKEFIGDLIWQAEYMQEPIDAQGLLFPESELQRFTLKEINGIDFEANIGVVDTADEGTDFFSAPMAKKIGELYYIYDVVFTTEPVEITEPLIVGTIKLNNLQEVRIESNNGGKMFALNVSKQVDAHVTWKTTTSNKETRILMDSAWIKKKCVFRSDIEVGSEYWKFMNQITKYMKGGKNKHDDAPDSLSLLRKFSDELGLNNNSQLSIYEKWDSVPVSLANLRI